MTLFKHIVFWLVMMVALTILFGVNYHSYSNAFYFVTSLFPIAIGTSYFFNYFLVPTYLLKRKYGKFFLYTVYCMIVSWYLEMVVIYLSYIVIANLQYEQLNPILKDVIVLAITLYLIVLVKSVALLFRRVLNHEFEVQKLQEENESLKEAFITVRADRKNQQVALQDILYIESLSDYVKIHTLANAIITREKISAISEQLPDYFLRIHRSFVVNSNNIDSFNKEVVVIGDQELPLSRTFKPAALDYLKKA